MSILFDLNHPAHYHLFKNAMRHFRERGEEVVIASRKKDVLIELLEGDGWRHHVLSSAGRGTAAMASELVVRDLKLWQLARRFHARVLAGSSAGVAHAGWLLRRPSVVFAEDDENVTPVFYKLTRPFVSALVTPDCLWDDLGKRHIKHASYHELAYLHPDHFTPDPEVPKRHGLMPGCYAVARFSALAAHHDTRARGIPASVWEKMKDMINRSGLEVVSSIENAKTHRVPPADLHHVLAFAKIVVSDSQTTTAEAAVLGVPAFRMNTFVGNITYLEELEHRYGLTRGFRPEQTEEMLEVFGEALRNARLSTIWRKRREKMLEEKIDLARWMCDFLEEKAGIAKIPREVIPASS